MASFRPQMDKVRSAINAVAKVDLPSERVDAVRDYLDEVARWLNEVLANALATVDPATVHVPELVKPDEPVVEPEADASEPKPDREGNVVVVKPKPVKSRKGMTRSVKE